ncbi:DUF7093 family protein [Haloarchaeobius sp. TZWWS8]|uniref:DUF7093 family protein n=1 Tax=Haloarchaeobius sp. TZWWS8 TaxID=3446121 RepID=UPI003EC081CD
MGLKCSLLGHDWSETEIEDERDEQGNEVVMTVREYEVCSRCDSRNLLSENTEVTSVQHSRSGRDRRAEPTRDGDFVEEAETDDDAEPAVQADDGAALVDEGEEGDEESAFDDGATGIELPDEPEDDDAMILNDEDDREEREDLGAADPEEDAETDEVQGGGPEPDPSADPETDDGLILDDAAEPTTDDDRAHGEWPEHETGPEPSGEDHAWPEHDQGTDEGFDATVPENEVADVELGGARHSSDVSDDGHDAEFIDDGTSGAPEHDRDERARGAAGDSPTGIASAGEATAPTEGTTTSVDADLVCPACGNTEHRSRTSLRAGDICPDCKRGYLSESRR